MPQPATSAPNYSRQRAIALHAATVGEVLSSNAMVWIAQYLTASQMIQLQRYLDASVVNPAVKKEAEELQRRGSNRYGTLVYTDPATKQRVDKVLRDMIGVNAHDNCLRVDITRILTADALQPQTDNPDEADYLERAGRILAERGVWLRIEPKMGAARQYRAWLSLGPEGDTITAKSGRIDRATIMNITTLGAGYYESVDLGPVNDALTRERERLYRQIQNMLEVHGRLARMSHRLAGDISELMGGATLPSMDIWDKPSHLLRRAGQFQTAGKVYHSRAMLIAAALASRDAGRLLSQYSSKVEAGAEMTVKILGGVSLAGQIADMILLIVGAGALFKAARAGAKAGGKKMLKEKAQDSAEDSFADYVEHEVANWSKADPNFANELRQVTHVPSPKGSISGNRKGGHSSGTGKGMHKW